MGCMSEFWNFFFSSLQLKCVCVNYTLAFALTTGGLNGKVHSNMFIFNWHILCFRVTRKFCKWGRSVWKLDDSMIPVIQWYFPFEVDIQRYSDYGIQHDVIIIEEISSASNLWWNNEKMETAYECRWKVTVSLWNSIVWHEKLRAALLEQMLKNHEFLLLGLWSLNITPRPVSMTSPLLGMSRHSSCDFKSSFFHAKYRSTFYSLSKLCV
jgi:hypothetical protein